MARVDKGNHGADAVHGPCVRTPDRHLRTGQETLHQAALNRKEPTEERINIYFIFGYYLFLFWSSSPLEFKL